jgi:hypothetical protein
MLISNLVNKLKNVYTPKKVITQQIFMIMCKYGKLHISFTFCRKPFSM